MLSLPRGRSKRSGSFLDEQFVWSTICTKVSAMQRLFRQTRRIWLNTVHTLWNEVSLNNRTFIAKKDYKTKVLQDLPKPGLDVGYTNALRPAHKPWVVVRCTCATGKDDLITIKSSTRHQHPSLSVRVIFESYSHKWNAPICFTIAGPHASEAFGIVKNGTILTIAATPTQG